MEPLQLFTTVVALLAFPTFAFAAPMTLLARSNGWESPAATQQPRLTLVSQQSDEAVLAGDAQPIDIDERFAA